MEGVCPGGPFPVGLRLSNRAAMELGEDETARFADWLHKFNAFVPTINGFPYGSFHSSPVKGNVYLPDWRDPERVTYTNRLATLLDRWLPEDVQGSISTVPVGFRASIGDGDLAVVRSNLLTTLEQLDRLRQKSGKRIVLALEPEPGCFLETSQDVVAFFERMRFQGDGGIGICYDCCHQAVEFEEPADSMEVIAEAGISIAKVQVSSALRFVNPDRSALISIHEPCYLHQTVIRGEDGALKRYDDLPDALQNHVATGEEEWRIHFHVPIFAGAGTGYDTTRFFIEEALPMIAEKTLLEVETYTWNVLPAELRTETVTQSIIREIQWLKAKRDEAHRRS